ncbi:MAG TPA: FtsX-like permease family protein [Solirubrobacterales bacterium]|nr:FtsX-like permease family protein [Solirubrobacterales bacterium]
MTRLAIKSLWARKVRAFATSLAVILGVAFIAGSYVLTDTIFAAFDEIFSESLQGTAVVITAQNPVKQESGEVPTIPDSYLPKVKGVSGVKEAAGAIFTPGGFFDEENDAIGTKFAPKFISSTLPKGLESLTYVDGRKPHGPGEASLDKSAAESANLEVGDTLKIIGAGKVEPFKLVGLTQLGQASFGGASIAQVTLPVAQRLTHERGQFDQISVSSDDGVSEGALKKRIEKVLPLSARVETAKENADRSTEEIRENLGFLQTILLVFGYVAVLVGAFIIFNTFSITVAQRISEFGVLRTLGASRRQILSSVLLEAAAIGLIGAIVGLAGGYAVAAGLRALFSAIGADLPTTSPVLEARTVIVSFAVAFVVTGLSALIPAVRSTRVPPIAALHAFSPPPSRRRRVVLLVLVGLLSVAGIAFVVAGLAGGGGIGARAARIGGGGLAVVVAVSLFSPALVRPLADLTGRPLELVRHLTGRLARENAKRNPGRTATTAAALMIALALVTFITVFASGLKSSVAKVIDENFAGGLVIENSDGFSPIPAGAALAAAKVPGVKGVATIRTAEAKVVDGGSGSAKVNGTTPDIEEGVDIEWVAGGPRKLRRLKNDEAIVSDDFAKANHLEVGGRFTLLSQAEERPTFTVAGEFESKVGVFGDVLVTQKVMADAFKQTKDTTDFVILQPNADPEKVQAILTVGAERAFPTAEVLNQGELREEREKQIDSIVSLFYVLLGLAVVISLIGVANTLGLSIYERTRELGMLRAIGMSRRQVRTMIRYEAVITALIGAILGLVLGVIFAALIAQPLKQEGFTLSYPVGTLIGILVLAALAGVIAAIVPARRASRLDVLESLQYE